MSYSLNNWLTQLSNESEDAVATAFANPEEITVVTPETTSEVEDELAELAEKISDSNRELDQVLEASDAIVSTEAIMMSQEALLTHGVMAGKVQYTKGMQRSLQGQIVTSLEAYRFPVATFQDMVDPSFEADEGGTAEGQAKKDVGKIRAGVQKLMAMLAGAAKAAKALFVRFLDLFRTSNEKNKRSVEILQKLVSEMPEVPANDKVKSSGFRDLVVSGTVDPLKALQLVEEGYSKHLQKAQNDIDNVIDKVTDMMTAGPAGLAERVMQKFGKAHGTKGAAGILAYFLADFPKEFKAPLAGNREATFTVTTKSAGNPSVSFSISAVSGEAPAESPVMAKGDLSKLVEALKKQYAVVNDINKDISENIKVSEAAIAKAEAHSKTTMAVSGEDESVLKQVVGAANAVLNISKAFLPKYNQMALATGHSAYKFGLANVKAYGKAKKADNAE